LADHMIHIQGIKTARFTIKSDISEQQVHVTCVTNENTLATKAKRKWIIT
jgi:hypothetical protein